MTDLIRIGRILVDVDALAPPHPALAQAFAQAQASGAALTVVDVLAEVPRAARTFVTPEIEAELLADRQARLEAMVRDAPAGVAVETAVLRGRPALALVRAVLRGGYDLVIRAHRRDLSAEPRPYGAVDIQLLRTCPCPVWIAGPEAAARPRRVMVAINAQPDGQEEEALNAAMVGLARTVRDPAGDPVRVLFAWLPYGEELMRPRLSEAAYRRYVEESEQIARAALARAVAACGPAAAGIEAELVRGLPEEAIPKAAAAHRADLIVMGTVARTGIAGLVIGNTAERVLRRIQGSVLAVKPPGFVSPVTLDETAASVVLLQ